MNKFLASRGEALLNSNKIITVCGVPLDNNTDKKVLLGAISVLFEWTEWPGFKDLDLSKFDHVKFKDKAK